MADDTQASTRQEEPAWFGGSRFWYRRCRKKKSINKPIAAKIATHNHRAQKYRAVSIQFKPAACAAVKELAEQRFPAQAVPSIPLSDCDRTRCQCCYAHHSDRRAGDERRSTHSLQTELYTRTTEGQERRVTTGRRLTDITDDSGDANQPGHQLRQMGGK